MNVKEFRIWFPEEGVKVLSDLVFTGKVEGRSETSLDYKTALLYFSDEGWANEQNGPAMEKTKKMETLVMNTKSMDKNL